LFVVAPYLRVSKEHIQEKRIVNIVEFIEKAPVQINPELESPFPC
jgi:hypothetical protein